MNLTLRQQLLPSTAQTLFGTYFWILFRRPEELACSPFCTLAASIELLRLKNKTKHRLGVGMK